MKHLSLVLLFSALLTLGNQLNAQTVSAADGASLDKVYENIMSAFSRMDAAAVAAAYTENGTHVSPDGTIVSGRASLKTYFENLFTFFRSRPKADKTEVNRTGLTARYLSPDQVLVTYTEEQTFQRGDHTDAMRLATSVILQRNKSGWLCELVSLTPVNAIR